MISTMCAALCMRCTRSADGRRGPGMRAMLALRSTNLCHGTAELQIPMRKEHGWKKILVCKT